MAKTVQITRYIFGGGLNSLTRLQTLSGSTSSVINLRNINTTSTKVKLFVKFLSVVLDKSCIFWHIILLSIKLNGKIISSLKDTPPTSAETCRVHTDPAAPDVPVPKAGVSKTKLSFNWKDPLDLESKLTDEEKLVRDTAYSYCQEKLLPRVTMANRNEVRKRLILTSISHFNL